MAEVRESASLYQLKNAEQKVLEIELAEQYIKDVLVAISGLAIDADKIDAVYAELDNVILVANDIDKVVIVADDIASVVTCANNIQAIIDAQLRTWEAEASKRTAASYATLFVDGAGGSNEYVLVTTSNGDGTYTDTPQTNVFSSKWYDYSAGQIAGSIGSLDSLSDVKTTNPVAGESLVVNPTPTGADDIWINGKVLGLPNEQGNEHQTVTNKGSEGDSFWSAFVTSPQDITEDFTIADGANASIVSGTIADGVTVTISAGSTVVVL